MQAVLDSAFPPSDVALVQAKAVGIAAWAGYFQGPNIYHGWALQDFHRVQNAGLATLAYCSGLADPISMRAQSLTWDVPICLDVESGIRPDGAWVQGWVNTAQSGLYGNPPVFQGRTAAFMVCAAYPGADPHRNWPATLSAPAVPCGWQWQGTHTEFGTSVDRSWFDDDLVALLHGGYAVGTVGALDQAWLTDTNGRIGNFLASSGAGNTAVPVTAPQLLAAIKAIAVPNANIQPALDAIAALSVQVTKLQADVAAVKAQLAKDLAP